MTDYISRQAAIGVLEERLQANGYSNVALVSELNRSIGYLMRLPSVQLERRKGKWITKTIGLKTTWYVCSECGRSVVDDTGYNVAETYPFCHCGADMRGEENEIN